MGGTSVDDVAAEAGVSRATVYRHVRSRGEIITAASIRTWERELADWDVTFAGHLAPSERLVEALLWSRRWLQDCAEPALARVLGASARFQRYSRDGYRRLLGRMRDEGDLPADVDLDGLVDWIVFVRSALWADTWRKIGAGTRESGPSFSPEMICEAYRKGLRVIEIPVHYGERTGGVSKHSRSFAQVARTAWRMFKTICRKRFLG